MRLEAYLGGLAIQIGERFILDVDLGRFYGRVPWGRGGWECTSTLREGDKQVEIEVSLLSSAARAMLGLQ